MVNVLISTTSDRQVGQDEQPSGRPRAADTVSFHHATQTSAIDAMGRRRHRDKTAGMRRSRESAPMQRRGVAWAGRATSYMNNPRRCFLCIA